MVDIMYFSFSFSWSFSYLISLLTSYLLQNFTNDIFYLISLNYNKYIDKGITISLQKKSIPLILQKVLITTHIAPLAKFTFATPAIYVTRKRPVFGIDINSVHSYLVSLTSCKPTYYFAELIQIIHILLKKYLSIIILWLFTAMRKHDKKNQPWTNWP